MALRVDPETFHLFRDEIGIGKVKELSKADAGLLASHFEKHPETIIMVASGVSINGDSGPFERNGDLIAIEWNRRETKPKEGETEINVDRYLIGFTRQNECIGLDVTHHRGELGKGQINKHWTDLEATANAYRFENKQVDES